MKNIKTQALIVSSIAASLFFNACNKPKSSLSSDESGQALSADSSARAANQESVSCMSAEGVGMEFSGNKGALLFTQDSGEVRRSALDELSTRSTYTYPTTTIISSGATSLRFTSNKDQTFPAFLKYAIPQFDSNGNLLMILRTGEAQVECKRSTLIPGLPPPAPVSQKVACYTSDEQVLFHLDGNEGAILEKQSNGFYRMDRIGTMQVRATERTVEISNSAASLTHGITNERSYEGTLRYKSRTIRGNIELPMVREVEVRVRCTIQE